MNTEIVIRSISSKDYESISRLSQELGSKITPETVKNQVNAILVNPDHEAYVALKEGIIVGYIHYYKAIRLTCKPFIEICGLVVDEQVRGNGIGKQLVKHLEDTYSGKYTIRVRCNVKRGLAHKFYLDLGYVLKKEQKIFEKSYI